MADQRSPSWSPCWKGQRKHGPVVLGVAEGAIRNARPMRRRKRSVFEYMGVCAGRSQKRTCPHHVGMDRGEGSGDMLPSVASVFFTSHNCQEGLLNYLQSSQWKQRRNRDADSCCRVTCVAEPGASCKVMIFLFRLCRRSPRRVIQDRMKCFIAGSLLEKLEAACLQ